MVRAMKLLLYILPGILLYWLYAVLRFAVQRRKLLNKFKKFSAMYHIGCDFYLHRFLLPGNRWGSAVILKAGDTVFNIRLFCVLRKHCSVHFWNERNFHVRKNILRGAAVGDKPFGRYRKMGSWDVLDWQQEKVVNVLLYSPANSPFRVTRVQHNFIRELMAGEYIGDVMFADSDYFFRYIANRYLKNP